MVSSLVGDPWIIKIWVGELRWENLVGWYWYNCQSKIPSFLMWKFYQDDLEFQGLFWMFLLFPASPGNESLGELSQPNINTINFFLSHAGFACFGFLWTFKVGGGCTKPILALCKKFHKFPWYVTRLLQPEVEGIWGAWNAPIFPRFFCTFSAEGW